jgi:hypothetical protein
LSRQLDKQQPAQDNSCLAPIFLKIRTHALCPEKPPGSPELSLANFWSHAFVTKILYDLFPLQRPKIHELIELTAYKIVKISLLNITGKIFERILTNKLNLLLESHNLLPPEQFGFRAQRSTQNPIV